MKRAYRMGRAQVAGRILEMIPEAEEIYKSAYDYPNRDKSKPYPINIPEVIPEIDCPCDCSRPGQYKHSRDELVAYHP
jgi:hypothetical protein